MSAVKLSFPGSERMTPLSGRSEQEGRSLGPCEDGASRAAHRSPGQCPAGQDTGLHTWEQPESAL